MDVHRNKRCGEIRIMPVYRQTTLRIIQKRHDNKNGTLAYFVSE
jgi:hypothetical protein